METYTENVDFEKLSTIDLLDLIKNGASINSILEKYKNHVFEKHKDSDLVVKWAAYAGHVEAMLHITFNALKNDKRI